MFALVPSQVFQQYKKLMLRIFQQPACCASSETTTLSDMTQHVTLMSLTQSIHANSVLLWQLADVMQVAHMMLRAIRAGPTYSVQRQQQGRLTL